MNHVSRFLKLKWFWLKFLFMTNKHRISIHIEHHETETFEEANIIHQFVSMMANRVRCMNETGEPSIDIDEAIWAFRQKEGISKTKNDNAYTFNKFVVVFKTGTVIVKVFRKRTL